MSDDQSCTPRLRWYSFRWGVLFWIVVVLVYFARFDEINRLVTAYFSR